MLEKEIEEIKEEGPKEEDPKEEDPKEEDPKEEDPKEEDPKDQEESLESVPERFTYESTVEITQSNQSSYADFNYTSYSQLFWGSLVNGLIVGVMIALISSVIRNCFKIVTLNLNKED